MTINELMKPRLNRTDSSAYLQSKYGIKRTPGTLAKLAVVGGGPRFRKIGARRVLYDVADLDAWAISITSDAVSSTSELTAA